MKTRRNVLAVTTVAVATAAMLAYTVPANAAGVDLKIGTIHPLTGGNADYGIGLTSAAEFARVNDQGHEGSKGRWIMQDHCI